VHRYTYDDQSDSNISLQFPSTLEEIDLDVSFTKELVSSSRLPRGARRCNQASEARSLVVLLYG
jgi:hypothetical protein